MLIVRRLSNTLSPAHSSHSTDDRRENPSADFYPTTDFDSPQHNFMFDSAFHYSDSPFAVQYTPFTPQAYEALSLSSGQQQNTLLLSEWQMYSDGYYNTGFTEPAFQTSQAAARSHQRNLSNSTLASSDSAYTHATSSPYPTLFDIAYQNHDTSYDGSNQSPSTFSKNIPTPLRTSTKDTFIERRNSRRGKAVSKVNSLQAPSILTRPNTMSQPCGTGIDLTRQSTNVQQEYPRTTQSFIRGERDEQYSAQSSGETTNPLMNQLFMTRILTML